MSLKHDHDNPDVMLRCLWLAGRPASFIRDVTGLGVGALGARCALLGLPVRDHRMRPVMGVPCGALPRLGIDAWVHHRRGAKAMT
ncbi:MAG: hypothetical protein F9K29_07985 [Hyphomicrobiaceae bacterium]|nr:MAG: hypothetical protein F9K29_07985 [Hyphomicrobiaceae bacterium]